MNRHQVEVLSNLRPETVVAVEGVPFSSRALALPDVVEAHESLSEVACVGAAGIDEAIDVRAALRLRPDTEERMVAMTRFVVAGGLCYDEDDEHCNPLSEGCANGRLYHRGRRAQPGEEADFFAALGRDADGARDLRDECVSDQLVARVVASVRGDRSLMATLSNLLRSRGRPATWAGVLKAIADAVHQEGWEFALDYVAQWFLDVPWWRDLAPVWRDRLAHLAELLCESEANAAWERAVSAGTIGHPLAILLDIYEHGGVAYSVAGTGMQCRWDTTRGGAVWVPDDGAEDNIRANVLQALGLGAVRHSVDGGSARAGDCATRDRAMAAELEASGLAIGPAELAARLAQEAQRYCRGVLDEYNAWVNGEVYGVVVYVLDRATGRRIQAHDDECWGFVGSEYAEDALEERVLDTVLRLGAAQ